MDVWEANSLATAVTPHMCTVDGPYRCNGTDCGDGSDRFNGVCDKNGCDLNPFRVGNPLFYGAGGSSPTSACQITAGVNSLGTIMATPTLQSDAVACCAACNSTAGCAGFTFVSTSSLCFLKSALGAPVADPNAASGVRPNPGPGVAGVDTTQPFTVVTQFVTSDGSDTGDLVEIRRSFIQNGVLIPHPSSKNIAGSNASSISDAFCEAKAAAWGDNDNFEKFGGLKRMGAVLSRGVTLVLSQWVDYEAHMLWLDSTYPAGATGPGAMRGPCAPSSGDPNDVIKNQPDSTIKFSKISLGPIGFKEAQLRGGSNL